MSINEKLSQIKPFLRLKFSVLEELLCLKSRSVTLIIIAIFITSLSSFVIGEHFGEGSRPAILLDKANWLESELSKVNPNMSPFEFAENIENQNLSTDTFNKTDSVSDKTVKTSSTTSSKSLKDGSTTNPPKSTLPIVASKSGTKYYFLSCSGAKKIKPENRIYFKNETVAKSAGLSLASGCKRG